MTTPQVPALWEDLPIHVNVLVIGSDPETGEELSREEVHNLIVTSGKVLLTRMLMDESGWDTGITYCEVGTDNTAVVIGDTDLNTGSKRNAITTTIRTANEVQFRTFFAAADITAFLKEVGLFGHSTASASLGTGELFNRAIISFDNSAGTKDMTIVIQLTVG